MKIPEPLFKMVNFLVRGLLNSPVHRFWSDSLMVIGFVGRKSGKSYKTPVRYLVDGELIQCFTSKSGKWWRSVDAANEVSLLVKGTKSFYIPVVTINDTQKIGAALERCLDLYPQDAVYHGISISSDGKPNKVDFESALSEVVLIELSAKEEGN